MISFKRAVKPVCQELVTTTTQEVTTRVEQKAEDYSSMAEIGIMAVAFIASLVLPHNPLVKSASQIMCIPKDVTITEIMKF